METMNIALPGVDEDLRLETSSRGQFQQRPRIRSDLIRTDQQLRHEERIDELLLEGLASGEPIEVDEAYWQAKKEKLAARPQHVGVLRCAASLPPGR